MKILHVNYSDSIGGAAIAVNRLHNKLLLKNTNEFWMCAAEGPVSARRNVGSELDVGGRVARGMEGW